MGWDITCFFPVITADHIGWQTSPFQSEVGMADLAIGVTACCAFWGNLSFKAAAVSAASIFLLGDAVGHVREMLVSGNFAASNAGVPFYRDVICPLLSIILLIAAMRGRVTKAISSTWPEINLEKLNCETLKIAMEQSEKALETQVAGFRILLDRCGKILAQSVTLAIALMGTANVLLAQASSTRAGKALALAAAACIVAAMISCFSMRP